MQIFLTGATGYIGANVAQKLQAEGYNVIGIARTKMVAEQLDLRGIQPFIGDLRDADSLIRGAQQADGVIHTAFIHEFGDLSEAMQVECNAIAAFAKALAGSGKPLIATSDTGVLGDTGSAIADENYPIAKGFILANRAKPEQAILQLAQQNIRSVVLRLPLYIYGNGGGSNAFITMQIQDAKDVGIARYIGSGQHRVSATHVDDIARLYVLALEKATSGSLYHAAAESGVTAKSIAEVVGRVVNCPIASISFDEAVKHWGQTMATFFAINNKTSAAKAIQQLGWQPKSYSFLEAI